MMFGLKDKKGGHGTTTTLPSDFKTSVPSSDTSLRNPFEKVLKAGKNIYKSFSTSLNRKSSEDPSLTNQPASAIRPPSSTTSSSRKSEVSKDDQLYKSFSNSTAPTEHSLPHLDCGETFFVPGISRPLESQLDPERPSTQEKSCLPVHAMGSVTRGPTSKSVEQADGQLIMEPEQLSRKQGKPDRLLSRMKAAFKKIALPQFMRLRPSKSNPDKRRRNDSTVSLGVLPDADKDKQCESTNNNSDDSDEDGDPRCDFETIEAIPDEKYCELLKVCNLTSSTDNVKVMRRDKGTYNAATFVTVGEDEQIRNYVVRVPGHGTLEHWTEEDAYVLKNEAQLIEYIRQNTTAPVAQIIHYSTGHDNALGFPYILMTMLPGKSAFNIWFPEDYPSHGIDFLYRNADVPPAHIEKKRLHFLRSLAQTMTQIQTLKFDAIGAPNFDDAGVLTGIGPTCLWTHQGGDRAFKRSPAATTDEYFAARFKAKMKQMTDTLMESLEDDNDDDNDDETDWHDSHGIRTILGFIFLQPAFHGSSGETFTLHHNDLDFQNILCDDEGNVTGIIDWDHAMAAPRCLGATSVPMFLRSDWFPGYTFGLQIPPCMAWNYEHYREMYAAAIMEASDAETAEFTLKSGLYAAAVAAITVGGDVHDLGQKLLNEIPHWRTEYWEFIQAFGKGSWGSARTLLQTHFKRIFEPQLPPEGLLEALDQELEMQTTWWSCCDEILDLYEAEDPMHGGEEIEDAVEESQHDSADGSG